jgi:hypothetical protein
MYIPVITILWALSDTSAWVNFPMVNFPFTSQDRCYEYIDRVRTSTMTDPQYLNGYSTCVYVGEPTGEPT